jgi:hypothetical protein
MFVIKIELLRVLNHKKPFSYFSIRRFFDLADETV